MTDNTHWEADDLKRLLTLLVGHTYGTDPMAQLDTIRQAKFYEAQHIIQSLSLKEEDQVIDLGAGCGFIAEHVAPKVSYLNCVDISESFLKYNRLVNRHNNNISYYNIPFADMSAVPKANAIYSVAVFIHFNLYDCYLYLQQCYNCLQDNGRLWFNFLNDQALDTTADRWQRHTARYLKDRTAIFTNVHYNNATALSVLATQIGFDLEQTYNENDHTFFLLRKR
jgi:cyclopropane fatty-acyl-phospholipid synthase-like methyltransferase